MKLPPLPDAFALQPRKHYSIDPCEIRRRARHKKGFAAYLPNLARGFVFSHQSPSRFREL